MFDAHCHLHLKDFDGMRDGVLRRAREAGVTGFLTCGVDDEDWDAALELAEKEPDVFAGIGIHPLSLRKWPEDEDAQRLERLASKAAANRPILSAIGECGLDARLTDVPMERQRRMLSAHLQTARALDIPVVLHCVRAQDELLQVIRDFPGIRGVLHGFSGSLEQARALFRLGEFAVSFGGALTLPSKKRRSLVRGLPPHLILAETDGPDGPAIQPMQSAPRADGMTAAPEEEISLPENVRASSPASPLEPAQLVHVIQAIAQLRNEPGTDWMERTGVNARAFLARADAKRVPSGFS